MGRQALGTIIAKSILENRIEADHRQIKQGVRVMQRFQMVRNAQVIRVGIELAYHFGKEKTAGQKYRIEGSI
jgi:transposase-like protein